jgi:hypothetical protein
MDDFTVKPDLGELSKSEFFNLDFPPFDIQKHCLYSVIAGSKAYGIDTPESDTDERGVIWLPERFVLGLGRCEQIENQSKDIVYYSLHKAFTLLLKNNIHLMELLWMPKRTVNFVHPSFQQVLDNKELFLSKRIAYTCGGYAWAQVKLGLTKLKNKTGRTHLVEKFGFDSKLISHAFRLLRMGRQALETGTFDVYRPDREFLLDIKNGKYKLEDLVIIGKNEKGKDIFTGGIILEEYRLFEEAIAKTSLKNDPPFEKIENLLIKIQKEFIN